MRAFSASQLTQEGKAAEAEPLLRQAVAAVNGEPFRLLPWQIAEAQNAFGGCLAALGHSTEAASLLREIRTALLSDPEAALRRRAIERINALAAHGPGQEAPLLSNND